MNTELEYFLDKLVHLGYCKHKIQTNKLDYHDEYANSLLKKNAAQIYSTKYKIQKLYALHK